MASGTVGATSSYSGGRGISFAKDIASRIVDAAEAAKNEKKHQQDIINKGGQVPEKDRKGLFVKALRQEFISNPINDLKKSFNKKADKVGRVVGLFGSKGEKIQEKLSGKRFNIKSGFNRSGYVYNNPKNDSDSGGTGSGGSALVGALGELVLDIQQIASAITSMQGLITTQMNMSLKMSDSLEQIKSALVEQVSLQQEQIDNEEMASREASLEASRVSSATAKATSTFVDGGFLELFSGLKMLGDIINFMKNLPNMFKGFFKGLLEKIPGGKSLSQKLFGKAVGEGAESGGKGLLKGILGSTLKPLRGALKAIPFGLGGLLDYGLNLMLGEKPGRAAAKAVGSTIGSSIGALAAGLLGLPSGPGAAVTAGLGAVLGGTLGDWLGGAAYDLFAPKDNKMAAGGGVMLGESGPEIVTGLHSTEAKRTLGGLQKNKGIEEVQDTYYSALAGSTLAITKDFVEGLGPVGASVAPIIQDDVAKLGREFDIPATATKVSVGGLGLRQDPQAAKKGENYLKELVKGTLEKLTGEKKEKDKDSSSGSTGSSSSSSADTSNSSSTPGTSSPNTPTDTKSSGEKTLESLKANTQFVNKEQKNWMGQREIISAVSGTDKAGVRRVKMVDDNGKLSDKYYYNANGDIFSIDPSLGQKGISQLTIDQIKSHNTNGAKFYRNLQTGQVVLTRVPPTGYYNYEKNGVVKTKTQDALPGSNNESTQVTVTTPISGLTEVEKKNFGGLPYGPLADISKIKAEGGIAVTSRRGNRTIFGGSDFHEGTDIGAPTGTKLYAFTDGKVIMKGTQSGYGNYIGWQEKTSGIGHFYAHMSSFGKNTEKGTEFKKGKILGSVGSTGGRSTGPHLHWEMADNPNDLGLPKGQGNRKDPLSRYNYMSPFSGKPSPGDGLDSSGNTNADAESNVDGSDVQQPESAEDMFNNIGKALTGIATGLATMQAGKLGLIKTEEDMKNYEQKFNQAFAIKDVVSPTGSTTTPTSTTPPSKPAGGGMNGARGSAASPVIQVQSTATPSERRSRDARPSLSNTAHAYTPLAPA